jgi:two-component system KDP operon response regulator KdpE
MKKILLAEGEEAYQALVKEALEAEGYAICLAGTRKEALDRIRTEKPDLVILDMGLPGGGVEMLGQIEQGGRGPEVILTARWQACDEGFLAWRAEEWVVKSKDLRDLKAAARRALAARAARAARVPGIARGAPAGTEWPRRSARRGTPVA